MRWLPPISIHGISARLPLADDTSAGLEEVLLADSPDERRARLAELIRADPALALWATCAAYRMAGVEFHTAAAATDWLERRLPSLLAGLESDEHPVGAPNERLRRRYTDLAAWAIDAAQSAHSATLRDQAGDAEAAYWAGLLSEAIDWLTAPAEPLPREKLVRLLPPRLAERSPSAPNAIEGEPRQSVAKRSAQAEAIRRCWQTPDHGTRRRLPALVRRLLRLDELQNHFLETLETEKLESLKQLAYGAGHEINNPLANISVQAQTLLRDERDPERQRRLAAINSQVFRAHEMIADLMLFSRPPQIAPAKVDLVALLDQLIDELLPQAEPRGTTIRRAEVEQPVVAMVDRVQLAVAIRAMCTNALEAIGTGGNLDLAVRPREADPAGDWAEIMVADDGPGIPDDVRRHLFDPFYSGREAGRGLGFGLSKCWRIVTDHGGRIEVATPERGAAFTIVLPAA